MLRLIRFLSFPLNCVSLSFDSFINQNIYHQLCLTDEREIKNLVLWLENQKIRRYKIEERGPLQVEGEQWQANFDKYCKDLASPIVDGSMAEKLEWLIGYAVSLEYADNGMNFIILFNWFNWCHYFIMSTF